jgi:integrase
MKINYFLKRRGKISPIYVVLRDSEEEELIYTGQKIQVTQWNVKERKPKDETTDLFHAIEKIRAEVIRVRRIMEVNEQTVTPYTLKEEFEKRLQAKKVTQNVTDKKAKAGSSTITSLIDKWIENGLDHYQKTTKKAVKCSIKIFQRYIKAHHPRIERGSLNADILNAYSRYLEVKMKFKDSSHGKTIKHLRWFLQYIKFEGPIKDLRIRTIKPSERNIIHLTLPELIALENVDVSYSIEMQKAKDMFLLGCYTGLRVSDLKRINKHRIENSAINMTLKKNRTEVSIPLLTQTKAILEKYDYSAPKISEQQVNESIKLVCAKAKINKKVFFKAKKAGQLIETLHPKHSLITTHCAGKTFISLAGERWGLSPTDIAAIVGKDIKTILGYYLKPDTEIAKQKMIEAENRAKMKVV